MPNTLSSFLNANKVLLLGLLAAIATTVQQFTQSGPVNYKVLAWAVVVAAIGFLANNLHGQVATILSSLLPTAGIIFESAKDNTVISWGHIGALSALAIVGAITGPAKSAPPLKVMLIGFLIMGLGASAQSPFKSEKQQILEKRSHKLMLSVSQPDSIINAWRFTANVAAYSYTFGNGGQSSELSGAQFGYEHQRYNYTTGILYVLWSVNFAWFPINTSAPITLSNIQTFGATFGFKNPLPVGNSVIQIGPDFNPHAPQNQQFGIMATIGILLN